MDETPERRPDAPRRLLTAIRQAVAASGRSQRAISKDANVNPRDLSLYLNEKRQAKSGTIERLLRALHLCVKPEDK